MKSYSGMTGIRVDSVIVEAMGLNNIKRSAGSMGFRRLTVGELDTDPGSSGWACQQSPDSFLIPGVKHSKRPDLICTASIRAEAIQLLFYLATS